MPGIDIIRSDEGFVTDIYFSQSWLTSLMSCPEQARLDMVGELPRRDTDATATGTAFHWYAEQRLKTNEHPSDLAVDASNHLFTLTELPSFEWVQCKNFSTIEAHLDTCIDIFEAEFFPQVTPKYVEKSFSTQLGTTDNGFDVHGCRLHIKGTPDMIDHDLEIWDWKTAGQERTKWEDERWSIQASSYAFLLDQHLSPKKRRAEYQFRYAVLLKTSGNYQTFTVTRDQRHFDWLRAQCVSAAKMIIENPTGPWLLVDQSWKCSPKWCGAWSQCKGKFLDIPSSATPT